MFHSGKTPVKAKGKRERGEEGDQSRRSNLEGVEEQRRTSLDDETSREGENRRQSRVSERWEAGTMTHFDAAINLGNRFDQDSPSRSSTYL